MVDDLDSMVEAGYYIPEKLPEIKDKKRNTKGRNSEIGKNSKQSKKRNKTRATIDEQSEISLHHDELENESQDSADLKSSLDQNSTSSRTSMSHSAAGGPGGKNIPFFLQRKLEEDALANERISAQAALNLKGSLMERINELETKHRDLESKNSTLRRELDAKKDEMLTAQSTLSVEIERLQAKLSDMERINDDLIGEIKHLYEIYTHAHARFIFRPGVMSW